MDGDDITIWPGERAFAPLAYDDWRETKLTLHLWMQIVGKIRLALAYAENHWWPEAPGIRDAALAPEGAFFTLLNNAAYAIYPYERPASAAMPSEAVLTFLESAYAAGAPRLGWGVAALARDPMPPPHSPSALRSSSI